MSEMYVYQYGFRNIETYPSSYNDLLFRFM